MSDDRKGEQLSHELLENPNSELKQDVVDERSESVGVRTSQRSRVQTVKGMEYQAQMLKRDYMCTVRAWQRQASKAESTLADTHSVELLQQERTMLISPMDDLANAYIRYVTEGYA